MNNTVLTILGITIVITTYIAHWWMMFFARAKIQRGGNDSIHDPLYNRVSAPIAFTVGFTWISFLTTRSIFIILYNKNLFDAQVIKSETIYLLFNTYGWKVSPSLVCLSGVLFALGFCLRLWAIRTLGRLFTYEVAIRHKHSIITAGPYQSMRHPSYMGYGLMILAMGLQYGSAFLLASVSVPTIIFFCFRIPIEERVLEKHFGNAWTKRKQETWLTFP